VAYRLADRIYETTSTTGTGALTLNGAVTGYRKFNNVLSPGDTCPYVIGTPGDAVWEEGIGTMQADGKLARTTIIASSNNGLVVNLPAGTRDVYLSALANNSYLPLTGGTLTGALVADTISANKFSVDSQFYAALNGTVSTITLDSSDSIAFDRTANALRTVIGGSIVTETSASGVSLNAATTITSTATPGLVITRTGNANAGIQITSTAGTKHLGIGNNGVVCVSDTANITTDGKPIALTSVSQTWSAGQAFPTETSFDGGAADCNVKVNSPKANSAGVKLSKGWVNRWLFGANNATETGTGNTGSDFAVYRYDDAGNYLSTPFQISRATGDITVGNVSGSTISGSIIAGTSVRVDPTFYMTISTNPTLAFDASDYMDYNRSTNTLRTIIGGTTKLTLTSASLTSTVPILLPTTQSTTTTAAVHKSYVDGQITTVTNNANGRLSTSGGSMTGNIDINTTAPELVLRYLGVNAWGLYVASDGALYFRNADNGTWGTRVETNGRIYTVSPRAVGSGAPLVDSGLRFGPWRWSDSGYIEINIDGTLQAITPSASDERLKDNIRPTTRSALSDIRQLDFIDYEFKKLPGAPEDFVPKTVIGGISAQVAQTLRPEWVQELSDGTLHLNTTAILTNALQAIRELDESNRAQSQLIEQLQARVANPDEITKLLLVDRLIERGTIHAALAALDSDPIVRARWDAATSIRRDDATVIALLESIGEDPEIVLAPAE